MFCIILQVQNSYSIRQIINEITTDTSHLMIYFNIPAGASGIGHGQVDTVGKGLLLTPSIAEPCGRTPTCYICNKKGPIKANCWFIPINKGRQG